MMGRRTLGFYIAVRFLTAIVLTFLINALLIFMIDFVELLRQSGKYGAVGARNLALIAGLRLPAYTEFLIGFSVLSGSIAALVLLSRKSELVVMRAGGMSVWQFLRPGLFAALAFGLIGTFVLNPLAAKGRDLAEKKFAEVFGRDENLLRSQSGGSWLRQNGVDGQSVIGAATATNRGLNLTKVIAFVYDDKGQFVERLDAASATLKNGYWRLADVWVSRFGEMPEKYPTYLLATYLSPERVQDALGTVYSLSVFELPKLIEVAEKAKLSSERLRIQYELLLSRPILCLGMVLLAATVSLRSFRSGGIQTMVASGMIGGVGFFLMAEVSRQIGTAGLAPAWVAVWLPVCLLITLSATVLLHQEDG